MARCDVGSDGSDPEEGKQNDSPQSQEEQKAAAPLKLFGGGGAQVEQRNVSRVT